MNIVNNAIICISCKQKLKAPVILPCGHSICKHHIEDDDKEKSENNKRRKIECNSCNESHEIPKNGFAPNRSLESLMEVNIDEIDMGEEYNSAFEKCIQFNDLLEQFNKAKNDPETQIHSVLSDLRNKVDLRREELKDEIDKKALEIIDKINEYEKDCKESIKLDYNLDNKIEEWKNELDQSQLVLKTLKKNTEKWNEISNKMIPHLKDLQTEFLKLNESLFLKRLDEFMYSDLKLTSDFYVTSVEIKELSRYKDIKEAKMITQHVFKAFGIEWFLKVYVFFNNDDIERKDKQILILFTDDLVILNQMNMNKSKIIDFKRESKGNWNFNIYSRLNRQFNDYYSYNIEKDSFIVQVVFKKIEWI